MAELPKYRPLGVGIPSVPTVDFVATGAAQARALDAVTKGLNSMSDYVYKKQVAQTQREAMRYAFENPVTAEQIEQALADGRDMSEVVGDPDTVFGAVTTAATATQLSTELQTQLTSKLAVYNAMIEGGDPNFDPQAMRNDLTAMITGHSELIAGVDPEAALKYNATANTLSAATYKSGLEHSFKIAQALTKDRANAELDKLPNIVKRVLLNHAGDIGVTTGTIATQLKVANNAIIETGDATFIESAGTKIRDIVTEQYQNVLADWAGQSSANTKRALQGDFGDRFTSLYGVLDDKEKAGVRDLVRKQRDARIADNKVAKDIGLANAKKEVQRIQTRMADLATTAYQGADYNSAVDQLQALAILYPEAVTQSSITSLDKALDPSKDPKSNFAGMFELKRRVLSNEIQTMDDLQKQAMNLGVGAKDYYSIVPFLQTDVKAEATAVDRIIRRNAKIVDGSNASETQSKAYFKFDKVLTERYDAKIEEWEQGGKVGIMPTKLQTAQEIDLEYRRSDEQKDVNSAVANLVRDFGPEGQQHPLNILIDEDTTEQEIKNALVAKGLPDRKLNELMNIARSRLSIMSRAVERRDALR